jgi:hypothetical protein
MPIILARFWWNLLPLTDFRNMLKYRISKNPSIWRRVVRRGRTDGLTERHGEGSTRFSQLCERVRLLEFEEIECLQGQNTAIFFQLSFTITNWSKPKTYWESILLHSVNPYDIVKSVHMPLCSPQIQNILTSVVTGLKITAWSMQGPPSMLQIDIFSQSNSDLFICYVF